MRQSINCKSPRREMRLAVIIKKNSIQHQQVHPREVLRYAPAEESRINFYIKAVLEPGLVFPVWMTQES